MTTTTRSPRRLLAAVALPLLLAGLTACSSGTSDGDQGSIEDRARDYDRALSTCAQEKGFDVEMGNGTINIDAGSDDADMDGLDQALGECTEQVDAELGERPVSEKEKKQQEESEREWAKIQSCLEDAGVVFPEPGSGLTQGPEIPDDVAAACGAEGMFSSTGGGE